MRDVTPVEALDMKLVCYERYRRVQRHPGFRQRMDKWLGDQVSVQDTWVAESIPVAWAGQTYEFVRRSAQQFPDDAWPPLPHDARLKLLVFPAPLLHMDVEGQLASVDALLVGVDRVGMFSVTAFTRLAGGLDSIWWYQIRFGGAMTKYINGDAIEGRDVEIGEVRTILKFVFATWAFLDQRIAIEEHATADRSARRRAERLDIEPVVHVVRLRKSEARTHNSDDSHDVEWSCQWLVRGHWRNQWHPRMQRHAPVWILPHIKGPADMPLKTPAPEVWQVAR